MSANYLKFIRAFRYYFSYYARLFPWNFSLQVIGVCSGVFTLAVLAGLFALSGINFYLPAFSTLLAWPLLVNGFRFVGFYRKFKAGRADDPKDDSPEYTLDSTFINNRIDQLRLNKEPEPRCYQHLIFETLQNGIPLRHLAVWSSAVNREFFLDETIKSRWKFRVNNSLKWTRLEGIRRDWRARKFPLMFNIFDGVSRGKILSDDKKIGLSGTLVAGSGEIPFEVFPISFFDSLLTNGLAGKILVSPHLPEIFDFRALFPIAGEVPDLRELSDCPELANYIGVSTLLISGSHQKSLYIPRQSYRNQQSPGLLAPSGSGSLDWEDLVTSVTPVEQMNFTCSLSETVIRGMERELREELESLVGLDLKNSELSTKIIGYFRMYERAGKPEFVGVSVIQNIDELSADLQHSIEVHSIEKFSFSSIRDFKSLCKRLLENPFELSVPLRMSLLFLVKAMEDPAGEGRLNEILWY